ncbi:glycosyltransferase family 4 protein [Jeotgalibacillus proteolyticus]|uniref:glycosyltransferase family 4 protein n=1 Tax=Jeotgalibacillus proteolyticus TaxID=2082395 RepID=UPI003CE83F32
MGGKILFTATVDYHFKAFHLPYMQWFKDQGWEVHVAANGGIILPAVDRKYTIPIQRSPFSPKNIGAYVKLKRILDEEKYDIVHCHTPVGGLLTRLAGKNARTKGTKIIYTAHGFHFYKGAPLKNWLIYYPIEKSMLRYTDCLITINKEDYRLAKERFHMIHIEHVHGVGVDTTKFISLEKSEKVKLKKSLGYQPDDFLLFYAAEFNQNKNQQFLLHALSTLNQDRGNVKLLLAGEGPLLESCKSQAEKLGIREHVRFLGFQENIQTWTQASDAAVASSFREGLPVNVMESMACGLPVVAVENRGHRELVQHDKTGWTVAPGDIHTFCSKLTFLMNQAEVREELGANGRQLVVSTYSTEKVLGEKRLIYELFMEKEEDTKWMVH